MRVAVVGGGISGLAAAYRLTRSGASVTLYEASDRLGGLVRTESHGAYLMEAGPDCFLDKGGIVDLCRELGLEDQLIRVRPEARRSFIVRGGRLLPIPEGLYLMAPSAIRPFVRSPVVSWPGKARMLLDLVLPARRQDEDESLASFVRRRLGREALERLAQPLLGGIYGADPERLSLAATMPQFPEMERRHGSVIRGLLARRQQASGARYGLFLTFREGLQTLVDKLAISAGEVRSSTQVTQISPLPPRRERARVREPGATWTLQAGADRAEFDAICLAMPLPEVSRLIPGLPVPQVPCSSVATINLGFRRSQVRHLPEGAGFVIPQVERRAIMACTFSSQKFEGRAPADCVLLRAFAGGMLNPEAYALPDAELIARALQDLGELLAITGDPEEAWLTRCPNSMPQYEVGHQARVAQLDQALSPDLALAGNTYHGVGLPDCLATGFAAADRLLQRVA